MKDTILSILGLLILFFPTALKVWRDRNGVKHPDPEFIYFIFVMILCGVFVAAYWAHSMRDFFIGAIKYPIVSWCLYASIFNYWINYVHLKNGVTEARVKILSVGSKLMVDGFAEYFECSKKEVFMHVVSHLSKTAWPDKEKWWRALGWKGRLVVNALILTGGLILYFI